MHQGKVEEVTRRGGHFEIKAACNGVAGSTPREIIGRIGFGRAAKHVAGKLVQENDVGQRPLLALSPVRQCAGTGSAPGLLKALSDSRIDSRIGLEPARVRYLLEPK